MTHQEPPRVDPPKRLGLLARLRRNKSKAAEESTVEKPETEKHPHPRRALLEKHQRELMHGHAPEPEGEEVARTEKPKPPHHHKEVSPEHVRHESEPFMEPSGRDEAENASVEKSLAAIYQEGGNDLSKIERRRSGRWGWIALVLVIVGAGLVGVVKGAHYFWRPFAEYRGPGLRIMVAGPSEIVLGKEQMYVVEWVNQEATPLRDVDVRIGFPQDFQIQSFDPAPTDEGMRRWTIGDLLVGGRGSVTVKGTFVGQLGDQSAIQAMATYRPDGFSRSSEAVSLETVTYRDSVIYGTIILPPKIMAGDPVVLRYAITNKGEQPMTGLYAHLIMPVGFLPSTVSSSTFAGATAQDFYVPLRDLPPGGFDTAQVNGSFFSGVTGDVLMRAEVGRRGADNRFLAAQRNEARVPLVGGDLALRLVANGTDTDQTMDPGQPLRVAVSYQNTSPEPIKNAVITIGIESVVDGKSSKNVSLVDWMKIDDALHGASSSRTMPQTIRFDQMQIPVLETLAPQAEGTIEIGIPTLATASGTKDAWIRLTVDGLVPFLGGTKVNRTVAARPLTFRYRSRAGLDVEPRYFTEEGAPIGTGPLPPVVGKTTSYRVFWRISKQFHTLGGVRVYGVLPKIAAFAGKAEADAGTIAYDEPTRTVTWSLDEMPEPTKDLEGWFDVQLTPNALDAGRFASVLGETHLDAQDRTLGEAVSVVKPSVTTDLESDEGARGKGVVKEIP